MNKTIGCAIKGFCLLLLVVGLSLPARLGLAACGPIPATYALSGGKEIKIDSQVRVNSNTVATGTTRADSVVQIDGVRATVPQPLVTLDPSSFPNNTAPGSADVDSPFSIVAASARYYDDVTVKRNATASFSGGGPFHINTLTLEQSATLNLGAGTYYIDKLEMKERNAEIVLTGAPVNLFIGDKADLDGDNLRFNRSGNVADLRVYLYPDAKFDNEGRGLDFTGIVYGGPGSDDIKIGRNARIHGLLVTEEKIEVDRNVFFTYTAADQAAVSAITTCPGLVDHFVIRHDGYGIHCLSEAIYVTPVDASGNAQAAYNTEVILDTQSGRGSWVASSGNGVLSDATANDGLARYTFSGTETYPVMFSLAYPEGPSTINVDVYERANTALRDDDSEGDLLFSPSGFTVTANPLSNPPPSPINDPLLTQIAGQPFALHLTAYGQLPSDPVCGVIEGYEGVKNLHAWFDYNNPASGSIAVLLNAVAIASTEVAASTQAISFSQGQARLSARYKDVGDIRISFKDTGVPNPDLPNGIRGASNPFVVKPFDFQILDITRTRDGLLNPGGVSGFVAAEEAFSATVRARDADGDATPNYGQEALPEAVILRSVLVSPAGGANPAISNASGFSAFSAGQASGTTFAWPEVGVIRLEAGVGDADYLGGGDASGVSADVGYFYPHHFSYLPATTPLTAACSGGASPFTYMDETALRIAFTLESRGALQGPTSNYDNLLLGNANVAGVTLVAENANDGIDRRARLSLSVDLADPTQVRWLNGRFVYQDNLGAFTRAAAPDGPFDTLAIGLLTSGDPHGADMDSYDMKADTATDCVSASNCTARSLGQTALRYGRLELSNAHGPENQALNLALRASYFSNGAFLTNTWDVCSALTLADVVLSNPDEANQRDGSLVIGAGLSNATLQNTPALAGDIGLRFSAPGAGNTGYADILIDLSIATGAARPWLAFDWDGDPGTPALGPNGRATFGIYGGDQRHIYIREVY